MSYKRNQIEERSDRKIAANRETRSTVPNRLTGKFSARAVGLPTLALARQLSEEAADHFARGPTTEGPEACGESDRLEGLKLTYSDFLSDFPKRALRGTVQEPVAHASR